VYNLPFDAKDDPLNKYLVHFRLGVDGLFSDAPDTALYVHCSNAGIEWPDRSASLASRRDAPTLKR
jgi:hypothetical protein